MKLIAISGKRRSGKSTLAEILLRKYAYMPFHLAAPLKELCKEHFGLSEAQVNGDAKEHPTVYRREGQFLTARQIMIDTGKFYRSIDENYWINKLLYLTSMLHAAVVVVPDVRFENEIEALKKRGAYLVRLERDEQFTGPYINDPSETELDSYKGWDLHVPAEFNKDMCHLEQIASRVYAGILASR